MEASWAPLHIQTSCDNRPAHILSTLSSKHYWEAQSTHERQEQEQESAAKSTGDLISGSHVLRKEGRICSYSDPLWSCWGPGLLRRVMCVPRSPLPLLDPKVLQPLCWIWYDWPLCLLASMNNSWEPFFSAVCVSWMSLSVARVHSWDSVFLQSSQTS